MKTTCGPSVAHHVVPTYTLKKKEGNEMDRWEPVPVPQGDGRHDIGDDGWPPPVGRHAVLGRILVTSATPRRGWQPSCHAAGTAGTSARRLAASTSKPAVWVSRATTLSISWTNSGRAAPGCRR